MPAYKTIALELIQGQPELYEQLRSRKMLLPTMDTYAIELKASHEAWKEQLGRSKPGSDPGQVSSEAMELANEELQARLPSASPKDEAELMIDGAMAFLRPHTPPA